MSELIKNYTGGLDNLINEQQAFTSNKDDGWDKPEQIIQKETFVLGKKYTERKTDLENWPGKSIQLEKALSDWLLKTKDNKNLDSCEDRLELVKEIQDDEIIIDYLSSGAYVNRNLKKKKDWQSENDFVYSSKLKWIANFIVWPNQAKYNIAPDKRLDKDTGRRNNDGHRATFLRTLTISDVCNIEGEIWANHNPRNFINEDAGIYYERMMTDVEPIYNTDMDKIDLGNVDHIRVLLSRYNEWYMLLKEQDNIDSEMGNLLFLLDNVIDLCKFKVQDLYLIDLMKSGEYTYKAMQDCVNYTYRQIENKCSVAIPQKIAKKYKLMRDKIVDKNHNK